MAQAEVYDLFKTARNSERHLVKCREIVRELMRVLRDNARDPSAEGIEAAHTNREACDCPYNFDSPEGQQWLRAFEAAGGGGVD